LKHCLDNPDLLNVLDPLGMISIIENMDKQCEHAIEIGYTTELKVDPSKVKNILFSGVGGSAIVGDLVKDFMLDLSSTPVLTNRDYSLPKFVGPETLVFAISYSGNSEETLSVYNRAKSIGAQIITLSSGGQLKKMSEEDGNTTCIIPTNLQPRAAIGYMFFPLLVLMERLGFLPYMHDQYTDAIATLRKLKNQLGFNIPYKQNPAKQVAFEIYGHVPMFLTSTKKLESVTLRWKQQINENSKALAYWNSFPELNLYEVTGLEMPDEFLKNIHVIHLLEGNESSHILEQISKIHELYDFSVNGVTKITAQGNTSLGKLISLLSFSDFASAYLAILYGFDPTEIKYIHYIKKQLIT
jgi:glucose/mannose-6-phosphate isomerase